VKKIGNRSTFAKVMIKSQVYSYFFETQCILVASGQRTVLFWRRRRSLACKKSHASNSRDFAVVVGTLPEPR